MTGNDLPEGLRWVAGFITCVVMLVLSALAYIISISSDPLTTLLAIVAILAAAVMVATIWIVMYFWICDLIRKYWRLK